MKRIFSLVLAAAVIFCCCACSAGSTEATAPTSTPATATPAPTPTPEPEAVPGKVIARELLIPYKSLNRGDKVEVLKEDDDYYYIKIDGLEGFISKNLVRMSYEDAPQERTAYAKSGASLFENHTMTGTPVDKPAINTEITVVDELNGLAIVKYGELEGYMLSDDLSDTKVNSWTDYGYGGGGGDSGGGGGNAGGGSVDGGDIALSFNTEAVRAVYKTMVCLFLRMNTDAAAEKEFKPGEGMVFADNTNVYIGKLNYGETVKIYKQGEDTATLLYKNLFLDVPSRLIRTDLEKSYESWEGFAKSGAKLYSDEECTKEIKSLNINDRINVAEKTADSYLVEIDGEYYYMNTDKVSETENSTWVDYGYAGGGDSGGGGGPEWTEPVM